MRFQQSHQPVVFVGPYEHHSNEVTWRQGLATVVEVNLAADGGVDLAHLAKLLEAPEYRDRLRIGSFSAASNVTGMRTEVQEIARLLHAHGAYACFDFAASAPYVEIDMNPPARSRRRRCVTRRGVHLAAQVPGRPRLERRAGLQRAPVRPRTAAERGRRRHGGVREPRRPGLHRRHRGARTSRYAGRAADAEGRAGARPQEPHRRGAHRGPRAGADRQGARTLVLHTSASSCSATPIRAGASASSRSTCAIRAAATCTRSSSRCC